MTSLVDMLFRLQTAATARFVDVRMPATAAPRAHARDRGELHAEAATRQGAHSERVTGRAHGDECYERQLHAAHTRTAAPLGHQRTVCTARQDFTGCTWRTFNDGKKYIKLCDDVIVTK